MHHKIFKKKKCIKNWTISTCFLRLQHNKDMSMQNRITDDYKNNQKKNKMENLLNNNTSNVKNKRKIFNYMSEVQH